MDIILNTVLIGVYGYITTLIGWGTGGYVLLRFLGFKDKGWYWQWVTVYVGYTIAEIWGNNYFLDLGITISNARVVEFLNNDINSLFELNFFDYFFNAFIIFTGFILGRFLVRKVNN